MDVLKREVVITAALAVVIVLSALLTVRGWPPGLAVGVAICAVALLRRRNLAWAALAGLIVFAAAGLAVALGAISVGPLFGGGLAGLLVLGAAMVRTLPPRPAVLIGIAGTLVIAACETAGPDGLFDHRVVWALAAAAAWIAALAVGVYLRFLDFRHRQTLDDVRRQERLELARELHDVVAHHVTGIVVQAQAARFTGQADSHATLGDIEAAGAETLTAIRQLVGLLRDPQDSASTLPAPEPIGQLVERFARHGPAVELRLPSASWPPEVASTVYRVVQEALTNITRHAAGARSVTITITDERGQVGVEVTDDAPAGHVRPGGYGLVGMRERVEALGGAMHAGPLAGAGWAVQASVPVRVQP